MIYNDRLGDQTDQNEYNQSSQIGNISELNSDFFLDSINNNSSQKSSDQQMGLIQLENVNTIIYIFKNLMHIQIL